MRGESAINFVIFSFKDCLKDVKRAQIQCTLELRRRNVLAEWSQENVLSQISGEWSSLFDDRVAAPTKRSEGADNGN